MSEPDYINLLGVNIHLVTLADVLRCVDDTLASDRKTVIANVNVKALNLAYEQPWFRQFLNCTELVYCDGMGVRLGARIIGYPVIPKRFTPADWIWDLAQHSARQKYSMFLLGNPPGVAEKAAVRLRETYQNLRVVGTYHGFFDKNPLSQENQSVLAHIETAGTDILMVGFGMPVQEKWIHDNWDAIKSSLIIPCGAIFEYVAGDLKRGPRWMTDHYMEWLARLIISPQRYWMRYLRDNPKFIWRILRQKFSPLAESVE